jgi:hypothetical protein
MKKAYGQKIAYSGYQLFPRTPFPAVTVTSPVRLFYGQVDLSEQESQARPVGSRLSAANSGRTASLQDSSARSHDIKLYS